MKKIITIILGILCLILVGLIIYLITIIESKPPAHEFCVQNGYYGAIMDFNKGYCYNYNENIFDKTTKRPFAWDGTKWRFVS